LGRILKNYCFDRHSWQYRGTTHFRNQSADKIEVVIEQNVS